MLEGFQDFHAVERLEWAGEEFSWKTEIDLFSKVQRERRKRNDMSNMSGQTGIWEIRSSGVCLEEERGQKRDLRNVAGSYELERWM